MSNSNWLHADLTFLKSSRGSRLCEWLLRHLNEERLFECTVQGYAWSGLGYVREFQLYTTQTGALEVRTVIMSGAMMFQCFGTLATIAWLPDWPVADEREEAARWVQTARIALKSAVVRGCVGRETYTTMQVGSPPPVW